MTRGLAIALLREQKCHVSGEHYKALELAIKSLEAWEKLEKRIPQMASYTSDDGQDLVMAYDVLEFIRMEVKGDGCILCNNHREESDGKK